MTTGPETRISTVRLRRDVSRMFDNKLSGTVWIADVSLIPSGADAAGASAMKLIRMGLCILIAFSVLAFGTVEVWSQSLLELSAGMLFLLWAHHCLQRSEGNDLLESVILAHPWRDHDRPVCNFVLVQRRIDISRGSNF